MSTSYDEARGDARRERYMRETGCCPDCSHYMDGEYHALEPCGEPGRCDICERLLVPMQDLPICSRCENTARAAGRQAADAQRYPDPEGRR